MQHPIVIAPNSPSSDFSPQRASEFFSAVKLALVTMTKVDEVKDVRDKAEAIRLYARQQKDCFGIQQSAAEVKIRAERRMGVILLEMPKNAGESGRFTGGCTMQPPVDAAPTLAEMGIEKTMAHRCQSIARLPEQVFETFVSSTRDAGHELTTNSVLSVVKSRDLADKRDSHINLGRTGNEAATIYAECALKFLKRFESHSVALLLTDPPYMTDVDDIHAFAHEWLPIALSKVSRAGRAYVCVGAYPDEMLAYLSAPRAGMELAQVLVWTYRNTLGPSPLRDYKLNWQAILYFVGPDAPPLDCPVMTEQFSVQDINAPDGRLANRFHEWQKPDDLAERLVRHSTRSGDMVIDPFAGTGTFLAAASRLGRRALGCEPDAAQIELCRQRGIVAGNSVAGNSASVGEYE